MRIKNFTLLFLMGLFGLFTTNLYAQQDATIAPENIYYWIGEGENEVVFIVNWNDPDTALAWGYRFSEDEIMLKDMMLDIQSADYRFGFQGESYVTDITFNDGVLDLHLAGMYWMSIKNGEMCMNYFDDEPVHNGDYVKWGDESCGTLLDPVNYVYIWEKEVAPVYALAEEAVIDPSEILYWVGEGPNEVVFAVNWNNPNVCYAWGFRFSSDEVFVERMMDEIAAADGRFDYKGEGGMVNEISFVEGDLNLLLYGAYWMYNINGGMAWYGYNEQTVVNGDFVKFGDESCGTYIAPWTQVWEAPVQPVSVYNNVAENSTALSLYPNPATSYTMLEVSEMNNATVTVSDLQGRVLRAFAVGQTNEPIRMETEGFQAGLYFVTVSDGISRQTVKLSVK